MASNYWIKLYHEMLDEPKVGRLTDSQFRLTINLFLLAGDYEQDGYLPPIDDIRWRLRDPQNFDDDLQVLKDCGIISVEDDILLVEHFAERQGAMTAEERSRRRRERDRKRDYYEPEAVTKSARKAHESCADVDKDIDIDVETEKDEDLTATTPYSILSQTFVNTAGIPELSGGAPKYTEAIRKMVDMGVTPEILEEAILEMREKDFTIIGPSSCINACTIVMGRKNGKTRQKNGADYTRYLKGEYGNVGV